MNQKFVYLYMFDTMADWEIGYLTAELNSGRFYRKGIIPHQIVTVAAQKAPVVTMGGLKILPDAALDECSFENVDALILPGGDTWTETVHDPVLSRAEQCLEKGILVAAICGATFGLARKGLLETRLHTSNDLEYLKMICPNYGGEQYYEQAPAVTDGKLITASGIAPLEFSTQVLKALDVFFPKTLEAWHNLYQTQQPNYFNELMNSIQY